MYALADQGVRGFNPQAFFACQFDNSHRSVFMSAVLKDRLMSAPPGENNVPVEGFPANRLPWFGKPWLRGERRHFESVTMVWLR